MKKPNRNYQISKFPGSSHGKNVFHKTPRRPFWLPASSYYVLTIAAAVALFFLVWAILHEGSEETPWIPAGFAASIILGGAVFLREVVLRNEQKKFLIAQRRLDENLKAIAPVPRRNKLSLQQNAAIVREIKQKSEAAQVFGTMSERHWEVFEICEEYLQLTQEELKTVGVGSPRLPALRRGRDEVSDLHKFHLLNWAEIESRQLTQETKIQLKISDKLETAQKALNVLEFAQRYYPGEAQLRDSRTAVKEFITSVKVSHWVEKAERAAFKGNNRQAISLYRDALFYLARENVQSRERETIAEKINFEIENLRNNLNENKNLPPKQ